MRRGGSRARLLADMGLNDVAILRALIRCAGMARGDNGVAGSRRRHGRGGSRAYRPTSSRSASMSSPPLPLPDDIFALVATGADRTDAADRRLAGRILFCAKEAVYKAAYPLDREVLGYEDIAVDLDAGTAMTKTGRKARLVYCVAPRVVVLAFVDGG